MVCKACNGTGKLTQYPETFRDYCRKCLGSGCVLCAECPGTVAYAYAHDGLPLCESHMDIYYPGAYA